MISQIGDAQQKVEAQYERLSILVQDNEAELKVIEDRLEELSATTAVVLGELNVALAACEEMRAAEVQRNNETQQFLDAVSDDDRTGAAPRVRAVTVLQPRLEGNNPTPAEVTVFLDKYRAYSVASHFERAPPAEQRGYFFNCIPDGMYRAVRDRCEATTPAISEDPSVISCATILREEVLREHPLQERRATLFNLRQGSSQSFSDFITKMEQSAEEAEIMNMLADDILVMLYITGTNDDKLREKFLEVDNPTKKKLQLVAAKYYASQISMTAVKNTRAPPQQASSFNVGRAPTSSAQQGAKPKTPKAQDPVRAAIREGVQRLIKGGFCPKCGEKTDTKDHKCPAADHKCDECGKKGHFERVCQRAAAKGAKGSAHASSNNVDDTEDREY